MPGDLQTLLRVAAIVAVVAAVLAAAAQLDGEVPSKQGAEAVATDNARRAELARCRTITPEELEEDETCQAAWAENRRRFFALARDVGQARKEK